MMSLMFAYEHFRAEQKPKAHVLFRDIAINFHFTTIIWDISSLIVRSQKLDALSFVTWDLYHMLVYIPLLYLIAGAIFPDPHVRDVVAT